MLSIFSEVLRFSKLFLNISFYLMFMYAQVSLPLVLNQNNGSHGDQQWFLSVVYIQDAGSDHDNNFKPAPSQHIYAPFSS